MKRCIFIYFFQLLLGEKSGETTTGLKSQVPHQIAPRGFLFKLWLSLLIAAGTKSEHKVLFFVNLSDIFCPRRTYVNPARKQISKTFA